jgi:OOP family OmpA-OmpF porin
MRGRFWTTLAIATLASVPSVAAAQTAPSIDVRTWRPSSDPAANLVFEPVATQGPWQWSVGVWASVAQAPVVLRDASSSDVAVRPLAHLYASDIVASLGIGERAQIGVDVPTYVWQDGDQHLDPGIVSGGVVPTSGLGDIALHAKARLIGDVEHGPPHGLGLAALGTFTLPTGEQASFMGEGSVTASVQALAEYALGIGAVRASLGFKLRTDQHAWPDPKFGGVTFGDEIPWALGVALRPHMLLTWIDRDDRQLWEVAAHGAVPADPVAPFGLGSAGASSLSPALLAVDDRFAIGHYRDAYVVGGLDFGLDTAVGVPLVRAVVSLAWAPRPHDRDFDTIPDDLDECPDLPEDRDHIQDEDGCPDDDADGDGILDPQDACPLVPGVWWNHPKKNGCPAPDTDGDGIPDPVDACPAVKGVHSDDPKKNGCPAESNDRDRDGIPDDADKCPDQPEDKDGNEDFDGCPDPDDDGDGIPDKEDACPRVKGDPSTDPTRNGCPNPDRDGDSYDNDVDQCPDQPEVFNGVKDDDGCPDEGGKLLVVVRAKGDDVTLELARPIVIGGKAEAPQVDPASDTTLRAIALELNRNPDWTLAVGARPPGGGATQAQEGSLARAFAVVHPIAGYTHRDSAAETVGWDAVKQRPGAAATGLGLLVLVTRVEKPAVPLAPTTPTGAPAGAPQPKEQKK